MYILVCKQYTHTYLNVYMSICGYCGFIQKYIKINIHTYVYKYEINIFILNIHTYVHLYIKIYFPYFYSQWNKLF